VRHFSEASVRLKFVDLSSKFLALWLQQKTNLCEVCEKEVSQRAGLAAFETPKLCIQCTSSAELSCLKKRAPSQRSMAGASSKMSATFWDRRHGQSLWT
jgi:hypothetical protein